MTRVSRELLRALALHLSEDDRAKLIESLRKNLLDQQPSKPSRDLWGTWKGKIPADFDVDAALKEIRFEWLKELVELTDQSKGD